MLKPTDRVLELPVSDSLTTALFNDSVGEDRDIRMLFDAISVILDIVLLTDGNIDDE